MRLPNEPVRNTCPDINRLQKTIKEIRDNFASFKEEDNIEDFLDAMNTASWELRDIYNTLEELRNANSALRDWGYELTSLAENLESEKDTEIEELSNTISVKETEIGDLEDRINELENNIIEIQEQL